MTALKKWNGGVILISHDERFITSVANEVRWLSRIRRVFLSQIPLAMGVRRRKSGQVQRRRASLQGMYPKYRTDPH